MVKNGKPVVIRGECLCGAVSFVASGKLKAPTACHCAMCRRWHGALGVYTSSANKDFRFERADTLRWYRSGPDSERGFCGRCGSTLFWRQVDGDEIDMAMGSLEPPTGLRLDRHIWVAYRGDYDDIADDLPQYAASSAHAQPIAPVARVMPEAAQPASHTAHCLCGEVKMNIAGQMRDISACHCRQCLRWHGHSGAYSKARWSQIELAGADKILWYRSSEQARRGSCNVCGSAIFWEREGGDAVSIPAGLLHGPTGLRIRHHIFVADREDYCDLADNLPQFPGTGGNALPF